MSQFLEYGPAVIAILGCIVAIAHSILSRARTKHVPPLVIYSEDWE